MIQKLSIKEVYNTIPGGKKPSLVPSFREPCAPVGLFSLSAGKEKEFTARETLLLYNRQGELCLSSFREKNLLFSEQEFVIILPGEQITVLAQQDSSFLVWKANEVMLFYEYMVTRTKKGMEEGAQETILALPANKHISNMFESLASLVGEGFTSPEYLESKLSELLLLMRMFYSKELLIRFFQPLQAINHTFKKKVLLHYNDARTVEELASRVNLSRSGFHQFFKKTHGKSPAQWMKEEKAKEVYQELTTTTKTIKQIWIDHRFSSASYFNQFCRRHFGDSPSAIRKRSV